MPTPKCSYKQMMVSDAYYNGSLFPLSSDGKCISYKNETSVCVTEDTCQNWQTEFEKKFGTGTMLDPKRSQTITNKVLQDMANARIELLKRKNEEAELRKEIIAEGTGNKWIGTNSYDACTSLKCTDPILDMDEGDPCTLDRLNIQRVTEGYRIECSAPYHHSVRTCKTFKLVDEE